MTVFRPAFAGRRDLDVDRRGAADQAAVYAAPQAEALLDRALGDRLIGRVGEDPRAAPEGAAVGRPRAARSDEYVRLARDRL